MKQRKRFLFETVVNKWNSKNALMKRQGKRFAQTVVVNATIGIGASMLAGSGVSAWAAEDSSLPEVVVTGQQEQASPYKPETVSSAKYTEPLRDVPQTITVVPQAVMEEQGATTLRDVLRNVPGISIQAGEGGVPAGDNLSIRGFNARTDMFIDGVRDFGGYSRDAFNFEQIEVVKGPASSYAGRGSTGGSVNMVTKAPREEAFQRAEAGIGTDGYKRAALDVNQPIEDVKGMAFRVNGLWHENETPGRDVVENKRWGIAPSLALGLGGDTETTLSYFHLDQDNIPDYGIPWVPAGNVPLAAFVDQPAPVDFTNFYGIPSRDYEETATDVFTGQIRHKWSDDLSLQGVLRYGNTTRDSIVTAPRFVDLNPDLILVAYGTPVNRQPQSRDQEDGIFAGQANLTAKLETGGLEHSLVSGVEASRETSDNRPRTVSASTTNIFNPNPGDAFRGTIVSSPTQNEGEANAAALYAFDTLKLNDFWQLNGGLRWDRYKVDYTPAVGAALSRSDSMLSWRGGAVYKPAENGSVYFGVGTSFNPSAEGLTLGDPRSATGTANVSNPTYLKPEESFSMELGTKWDLLDNLLALSAALFRTDKDNARTPGLLPTDPPASLDGEQRVDGLELGLSGNLTEKWSLFAALTHMKSEILKSNVRVENGKELPNTPENSFNLWSTYQATDKLQVGAGLQHVDSRFNSATNTRQAPSYDLLDLMASYAVNEHFTLRLNAYNVTDEEYIDRVGGGHFIPGPASSATLTASLKL